MVRSVTTPSYSSDGRILTSGSVYQFSCDTLDQLRLVSSIDEQFAGSAVVCQIICRLSCTLLAQIKPVISIASCWPSCGISPHLHQETLDNPQRGCQSLPLSNIESDKRQSSKYLLMCRMCRTYTINAKSEKYHCKGITEHWVPFISSVHSDWSLRSSPYVSFFW